MLQDLGMESHVIGIAYAFFGIFAAVSASKANWFNFVFHNKYLKFVSIALTSTVILAGVLMISTISTNASVIIILILFAIQHVIKGSFFTLNKKYLSSFSTSSIKTKIYSLNNMLEAISATVTSLACSILLRYTSTAYASIIISIAFAIMLGFILKYMKTRVGLKPQQYSKDDIPVEIK